MTLSSRKSSSGKRNYPKPRTNTDASQPRNSRPSSPSHQNLYFIAKAKKATSHNTLPQHASLLDAIRVTSHEHDLIMMLLPPSHLERSDITSQDSEKMEARNQVECAEHESTVAKTESIASDEDDSQFPIGELEEIVDIEEAWKLWNTIR